LLDRLILVLLAIPDDFMAPRLAAHGPIKRIAPGVDY
jgi:hypothetical protein